MASVPGSTCSFVFVFAMALPQRRRSALGPGAFGQPVSPLRRPARGHARDLSGFLALRPTPLPGSPTPAGPAGPRLYRSCRCRPRDQYAEGSSKAWSRGSTPGF